MTQTSKIPSIGIVSLGCPKALVDSERIITRLRSEGYQISADYTGADMVLVNTCGFLDSAKAESLGAIGEAIEENGKVIVTGCLGGSEELIMEQHPSVLAVSGPHQYERVIGQVHEHLPPPTASHQSLVPESGIRLTPRHYAYLKISEGCNNSCSFCIIPDIRGKLVSRPIEQVLREAEKLANAGVKELMVISQDTSAYGVDVKYQKGNWRGQDYETRMSGLVEGLSELGIWVRMHYVYPYPHVDDIVRQMAEGKALPYLDIPFQHASPSLLKKMRRPAAQEKTLERILKWKEICPSLGLRSTFIVGFPGETEEDFEFLLDWMKQARFARAGCFTYEDVKGAQSNELEGQLSEGLKKERWERFMEVQQAISQDVLEQRVGTDIDVIIDEIDGEGAIARSDWDAPEIDGNVFIEKAESLSVGDIVTCTVEEANEYDLWAVPVKASS